MIKESTKASKAKKTKSVHLESDQIAKIFLAGYFLIMLVTQLFKFDELPSVLTDAGVGDPLSTVITIAMAIAGLLSLPFLIGLQTAPVLQKASQIAGFGFLLILTLVELFVTFDYQSIIFGTTLDLPGGLWSLSFLSALWVLAVWGSAGQRILKAKR